MFNVKSHLAIALCALSALVSAATSGLSGDDVAQVEYSEAPDQLDLSRPKNLTPQVVQARDGGDGWSSRRTLYIGIGSVAPQNVGTEAHDGGQTSRSGKPNLQAEVAAAIDNLCPTTLGFSPCNTETTWKVSQVAVKDKDGNFKREGLFTIKIGSSYWPLGGLRELLRDSMAEVIQTIAENNCWKPGFKGGSSDVELCNAPDKVMLRVDYDGWLVLLLDSDHKSVGPDAELKVCPKEAFYGGDAKFKFEEKVKSKGWGSVLHLSNGFNVETICYYGKEPSGMGNGWCLKDTKDTYHGEYTDKCPPAGGFPQ
ncbi:uncharacterized protein N0V89_006807 [Didymosphaeria variabile]|uniref:Uncharacterized protein n=1 Tax=Didymosphaeria variabile TaxID=1932322 RepID=A0A9W8XI99_9PLEO|nr:uncharacterized protein N0V89_006807 [Didymosphaeria variabile]KAJ4351464.1 hypothetical protein N0V89_006807 [Didymosphaeria variabile]